MRVKPKVCLIDEDVQVHTGWEGALGKEASLVGFKDYRELLELATKDANLLASFDCVIIGRYFQDSETDICEGQVVAQLRALGVGAIFLNWQGYLTKEEIDCRFDGRLFNKYGVRWQTLRSRVQKIKSKSTTPLKVAVKEEPAPQRPSQEKVSASAFYQSKPQRCQELLKVMARQAAGRHRDKLEYYATQDSKEGIALLEAIYNRLLTATENLGNCPSRYINSSPVVAKNILRQTLFG